MHQLQVIQKIGSRRTEQIISRNEKCKQRHDPVRNLFRLDFANVNCAKLDHERNSHNNRNDNAQTQRIPVPQLLTLEFKHFDWMVQEIVWRQTINESS